MPYDVHTVVVGAGVIGLAIARKLACNGTEVLILESNGLFGQETSARNSEVIHAGIYYAKDSLKAKLCVQGKHQLYDYCNTHSIEHTRCGKLIVATNDAQEKELQHIQQRAIANGVDDLQLLDTAGLKQLEPEIRAQAALLSPSTGIINSHEYMLSLLGEAQAHNAFIAYQSTVTSVQVNNGFTLTVNNDGNTSTISCKQLINAAGHGAIPLAHTIDKLDIQHIPLQAFAKGNYFKLNGKPPVKHLIYPIPEPGGLGIHITLDRAGQCRFGPDVQWQDNLDYAIDAERANKFYGAVRDYWPALPDDALTPDYAGIRPKIKINNELFTDFLIQQESTHGIAGLTNLFGMESPGLTASLAIADCVASPVTAQA
jgi:L-2-hydroxyglutarate oxidase LhgO